MLSLKYLTKKFNKQTLSEVKPAPLSETVDHTLPYATTSSHTTLLPLGHLIADNNHPSHHLTDHTFINDNPLSTTINNPTTGTSNSNNGFNPSSTSTIINSPDVNITDNPSGSSILPQLSPSSTFSSASFSSASSVSSSDSEDDEPAELSPALRIRAHAHSPRKRTQATKIKIERISSAEKRKYSQFKCSTGSSSPSSSDDEIKEAFDVSFHRQRSHHSPPTSHTWAWNHSSTTNFIPSEQPISGWNIDPFEVGTRPLKVVPVGRHKNKFFAQMSSNNCSERPYLDFNKMQHSKRLVMVRRPIVIRNNSKVHSIQRPPPPSLQVSLDISQHSFQPVLTQT